MPMDSPASDYPLVTIPETSAVYFKTATRYVSQARRLTGWCG